MRAFREVMKREVEEGEWRISRLRNGVSIWCIDRLQEPYNKDVDTDYTL